MKKLYLFTLATALLGFGACQPQPPAKKSAEPTPVTQELITEEFGELRLALSQEVGNDIYAITGNADFWILENGDRFGDDPWWTTQLELSDGSSVIVRDLFAEVPLEITMSNLRCYVNRVEEPDCEFIRTVPTPLVIPPNTRALARIHVAFGSDVTVIYDAEADLQLVVEDGSADQCAENRALVSFFGEAARCVNQCGVSCDSCQRVYGCDNGEYCIVPVDGLGLPGPPGVCAPDM